MRHTISVTVENRSGVLSRVVGLFSGRGFNIDSLSVGETIDPEISRITIVTTGDDRIIEQVTKQLRKLIDVIKVTDLTDLNFVDREMILIKVNATDKNKAEILRINDIFRGKIVDVSQASYTFEITGDEGKIQAFIKMVKPFGVKEIARTGKVAVSREM
jgi:acetolactate synthase-1/3 small subunit